MPEHKNAPESPDSPDATSGAAAATPGAPGETPAAAAPGQPAAAASGATGENPAAPGQPAAVPNPAATDATLVGQRDLLRFTTAGSVDDGKSTLIGRMLFDSKQIFQDQMEQLENTTRLRGEENVNLALLTDGLRAEREQGITIDVAYRYFSTSRRKFIIADTPGHEQYTRNMVTGASTADLAVILIDARNGVLPQSRRHGIIASLLGIPHVVVCVNKMDLVDYSKQRYDEIVAEYTSFAQKLNVHDIEFIPVSALEGDNVVDRSQNMSWYTGSPLLHFLENVTVSADRNLVDFRFPVQYVIRPHQDFRGFAGEVVSGTIKPGEEVVVLPGRQRSRVKAIHHDESRPKEAAEGDSVVLTLEDEVDVSRGDMIVRRHNIPEVAGEFEATLCWMDDENNLDPATPYVIQHTTQRAKAYVDEVLYELDVNTLHRKDADTLKLNEIGRVKVTASRPLFYDPYDRNRSTGGFILIDPHSNRTIAAGMIRHSTRETIEELKRERREQRRDRNEPPDARNIQWDPGLVGPADRRRRNGHKPLCLWFTGLSGSGKSTIAKQVEKDLFDDGYSVVRLDGDNLRYGLNADLGFSRDDRRENIARAAAVARLLYDYGHIVLCTFISPYQEDRNAARRLFPDGDFQEIYVQCELTEAERRDPKGLYARARAGEIEGFTGIDAPFEAPSAPELTIDTTGADETDTADTLTAHLRALLGEDGSPSGGQSGDGAR